MRLVVALIVGVWSVLTPAVLEAQAAHPRVWLTPSFLATLKTKAASGNGDWQQVKRYADQLLSHPMPRFTVVAASNTNPVQFTLAESVPFQSSTPIFIGGGSGSWAAVNTAGGDRPRAIPATRTGSHTFTVPIDATALGNFDGQHLVLFFSEGGFSAYGYQGSDWQSMLQALGLAYHVTGSAAYAAKGIELLDYIASLGVAGLLAPEAIDTGFPSRSTILGVALGYDWLYDRLTPDQRASIVRAINLWYDWFQRAAFENNGPAYGNYFGGHVLGFGLAGLATQGDNPRGTEIVTRIRALFDTHVTAAFTTGGFAGGYPVEAYTYGANHFQRLLYYMLAVKTATGDDLFASGLAQKIARSLLYNLKPNLWQVTDEGDYAGDFTGVLQPGLPVVLSHLLTGTPEGAWMQFLVQHLADAPYGGRATEAFTQFLFYDSSRQATDYRATQPTWYRSRGDEHVYWRSSWRDDAVWVSIAAGTQNWASHQARTAGHISIQRGNDYLLVNSGQWKGQSGVTGNPQAFDGRGWRANTLFVNDGGDYLFTGANYVGGQGFWGTNRVLAQEGRPEFAYVKTDLTSAYMVGDRKPIDSRSVRSFQRSVVALGSGIVVVFDRTQFLKDSYVRKLYFHLNPTGGVPVISGQTVTSKVGSSVLFLKTLAPGAPKIELADDPVSDGDARPITRRVEVSDTASGTTFNSLNVLIAAPSSTAAMPPTEAIDVEQRRMTGAIVDDGSAKRVVLFATDGTAQSNIAYTANYAAGTPGTHVLTDLTPGASYSVTINGASLQTVTASSQGVAFFQSTGGGRFEVATGTGATSPPSPPKAPLNLRVLNPQPGGTPAQSSTPAASMATNQHPDRSGGRFVAMVSPVAGELFVAPARLRLVAAGKDPNVYINSPREGLGGNAARVQFFVDDAIVLEVDGADAEYFVFKGFAANVGAGTHRVWARALYANPTLVLDSTPVTIRVDPAPAYSRTVDLDADLTIKGPFALSGAGGGRVRVNGNGHRIVASGSADIRFEHVDFFDLGDRTATQAPGMDLVTRGRLVIDDCTFDSSNTVQITAEGSAPATLTRNTFRSNMRQPLGQSPDGSGHGSFPVLVLKGDSSGRKVFQANNVGAGWVLLQTTRQWLIGGDSAAEANVLIGPRVGIFVDRSTDIAIRRNYSHHIYYGGWSQGSNFELGGISTVSAEHNVIAGSSWPVRGVGGEFRYNLVLDAGHEWLWADHDNANVHHNIFIGGDNDVGGVFVLYAPKNVRIQNNTFDGLNGRQMSAAAKLSDGVIALTSNLFVNVPKTAIIVGASTLTADYNLFWNLPPPAYSDGRTPAHDVTSDPLLTNPAGTTIDFDESLVWTRTTSVSDVLARYREKYAPRTGSPVVDAGDPAAGHGNDIGAVGGGAPHTLDQFGR